jgi:hypothetical protein
MDERPPLVAEIEEIIRRYLQAHPQAVDTERGIREWWLRKARRIYAEGDVRAAVEDLVATGELVERRLPDGQSIYASAGTPPSHNS